MSRAAKRLSSRLATFLGVVLLLGLMIPGVLVQPTALAKKHHSPPLGELIVVKQQNKPKPGDKQDKSVHAKRGGKASHGNKDEQSHRKGHSAKGSHGNARRGDDSAASNVGTEALSWSLSLTTSLSSPIVNQPFTLKATANQDVGPTPYYIQIYLGATRYASCGYGRTCSVTLRGPSAGSAYTFQARIAAYDGASVQYRSNSVLVSIRSIPSSWRLGVPFLTQVGSAPGAPNTGANNCGPASVAMAINYHYGNVISVGSAAVAIRGSNTPSNGTTDFKGSSTRQLLTRYGLIENQVSTFDGLRAEIAVGRPVIILVNNRQYRYLSPRPYENDSNGWFTNNHILVVTGYDSSYVYVNDPLRRGVSPANYRIPVSTFKSAASTTSWSSSTAWYAVSVSRA